MCGVSASLDRESENIECLLIRDFGIWVKQVRAAEGSNRHSRSTYIYMNSNRRAELASLHVEPNAVQVHWWPKYQNPSTYTFDDTRGRVL